MKIRNLRASTALLGLTIAAAVGGAPAAQANFVANPSFETPATPLALPSIFSGSAQGPSAALDWESFNNTLPLQTTWTDLLTTTLAPGPSNHRMIHVVTTGNDNIESEWVNTRFPHMHFSVWIFDVQGEVAVSLNHNGLPPFTRVDTTLCRWKRLTGPDNGTGFPTVLTIGGLGGPKTVHDFYVDLVNVVAP